MIDQGLIEEENHNEDCEPTVNVLSSDPYWGRDEDSSEGERFSDVQQMRENQHYSIQQVYSDDDDDEDIPALRRLFQDDTVPSLRNLTEEERKAFSIVVVEQVKRKYHLRNRNVNNEQGKPASVFAKVKKPDGNKDNTFKRKDANAKKGKEAIPRHAKKEEMPKLIKPVEKKQVSRPTSNNNSFMSQALSQVKISMPVLEVMKFPDYKNETLKIISNVGQVSREDPKSKEDPLVVYLGMSITKNPTQVDPFYLTLLINTKILKKCMIDLGAAVNIMLEDVMKELGMHFDTPYGKCVGYCWHMGRFLDIVSIW